MAVEGAGEDGGVGRCCQLENRRVERVGGVDQGERKVGASSLVKGPVLTRIT